MDQFETTRRTLPGFDMHGCPLGNRSKLPSGETCTGAAWLSSARAVKCRVKSLNERNPCRWLPAVRPGTLARLPALSRRKVGTTSSHHGLYAQGVTRATMGRTERRETVRWSKSQKTSLSSDWGLQFDPMKSESLVIAYQPRRGEYVPEPCTHRPSSHGNREFPKSLQFSSADGKPGDWD